MSLTNIESSQVFDVGGRLTSGRGSGAVARCFLGMMMVMTGMVMVMTMTPWPPQMAGGQGPLVCFL